MSIEARLSALETRSTSDGCAIHSAADRIDRLEHRVGVLERWAVDHDEEPSPRVRDLLLAIIALLRSRR